MSKDIFEDRIEIIENLISNVLEEIRELRALHIVRKRTIASRQGATIPRETFRSPDRDAPRFSNPEVSKRYGDQNQTHSHNYRSFSPPSRLRRTFGTYENISPLPTEIAGPRAVSSHPERRQVSPLPTEIAGPRSVSSHPERRQGSAVPRSPFAPKQTRIKWTLGEVALLRQRLEEGITDDEALAEELGKSAKQVASKRRTEWKNERKRLLGESSEEE
jgi:hypothetical protein